MMDLVLKNKSGLGYAQDLVVHIVVYGISVYHIVYDVPLSVWDKKYEITSDTLNFITHVEMTKELKIQMRLMMTILLQRMYLMIKLKVYIITVITLVNGIIIIMVKQ